MNLDVELNLLCHDFTEFLLIFIIYCEFCSVQHMKNGTGQWMYYQEKIGGGNTSYVIRSLEPSTAYELRLTAKNAVGIGNFNTWKGWVRTLDKGELSIN